MADKTAAKTAVGDWTIYTWSDVTENDTCVAVTPVGRVRAAVAQFSGTFGGATVVMQGSTDNSTFVALDDVEDAAISHTAAGGSELRYVWPYVRPSYSGGSSQSATAVLALKLELVH